MASSLGTDFHPMPALFRRLFARVSLSSDVVTESLALAQGEEAGSLCELRTAWDRAVVMSVARAIEPDPDRLLHWFREDPIRELGSKTARQLVEEGVTARLLDMLVAIRSGRRDD